MGTQVLQQVMNEKPLQLILEVDEPHTEPAIRRINFYMRLGFTVCREDYYQPPYSPHMNKVKMLLMSYPGILTQLEFIDIKAHIYREVYQLNNFMDFP
jgi:hypothetical protein